MGNLTQGKGWGSFSDINWGQVGLSAAVGAVAGGTAGLASGAIGWAAGADATDGWGAAVLSGAVGKVTEGQSERAIANVVSGRNALEGLFNPEDMLGDAVQRAAFGVGFKALGSAWRSLRGGGTAKVSPSRSTTGEETGIAKFDNLLVGEDGAIKPQYQKWVAKLNRRGYKVEVDNDLQNAYAVTDPIDKIVAFNPSKANFITLLHEWKHIRQFRTAEANDVSAEAIAASEETSNTMNDWFEFGAYKLSINLVNFMDLDKSILQECKMRCLRMVCLI